MTQTDIKITLDIHADTRDTAPNVTVSMDQEILLQTSAAALVCPLLIHRQLPAGAHRLTLYVAEPPAFEHDPTIAIHVDSVRFQHLDEEFKIFSWYRPIYPDHWHKENLSQGRVLEPVIHSNHLGWPGHWWIDFETPVYPWLHTKLDLGWLI